ncbi:hypothetical protein TNCV_1494911 [Trichonephila clavipes]|nr:hypothetical protein TNCV_1494911 [Trichonephila clavipes]
MAPHRPRKSEPTEYTTDEEDMIKYDVCVEEEPELNPMYVLNMDGFTYKGELVKGHNSAFIRSKLPMLSKVFTGLPLSQLHPSLACMISGFKTN